MKIATFIVTPPHAHGWEPVHLLHQIVRVLEHAMEQKHYGPHALVFTEDWQPYLEQYYHDPVFMEGPQGEQRLTAPGGTLKERLLRLPTVKNILKTTAPKPFSVTVLQIVAWNE